MSSDAPNAGARTGGMTHREIGEALGISHARAQQIEYRALAKLAVLMGFGPEEVLVQIRREMKIARAQLSGKRTRRGGP